MSEKFNPITARYLSLSDALAANGLSRRELNVLGVMDLADYANLVKALRFLRSENDKPITMFLNTGGGSVYSGFSLFDTIKGIAKEVEVNMKVVGCCMSFGIVLLQAGSKRVATPNSVFMIHELSGEVVGTFSQMTDSQKEAQRLQRQLLKIISDRSGLTIKKLNKLVERKDYYMTAQEALELNLIDAIEE